MIPKILILTPSLGKRSTLARTIQTVKEIGKDKIKHIVITPQDKILELQNQYPNTEFVAETGRTKGIYPQLNDIFFKYGKNYDWLGWINDDDWWLQDFDKLISAVDKNFDLDMVYGCTNYANNNGLLLTKFTTCRWFSFCQALSQEKLTMIPQQSVLFSSSIFFKVGGFSENYKYISDVKFWIDLSSMKLRYRYINAACAAYTIGNDRLSSDSNSVLKEWAQLLKEYKRRNKLYCIFAKLLFRVVNSPTYIRRFIMYGKFSNLPRNA